LPDITFVNGSVTFPTRHHGEVTLSERKWNDICGKPERQYSRYNGDKVATTRVAPDHVRHHKHEKSQFLYYKQFEAFKLSEGVQVSLGAKFMAVVIDTNTQRVCTVYPVDEPKTGKEYKPAGAKP
jgi:hypothetical protein